MTILIPFAGLSPAPWKNGGGSSTEIAIGPPGASVHNFEWRISLATISHSGPFSSFAGVDRTLALVEGPGLTLDIDGTRHILLDIDDGVIAFDGEAAVSATLHEASTTDFNVMTRRAVCQHKFGRRQVEGSVRFAPGGQRSLLFLAAGESLTVSCDDERIGLVRYDAVLFAPGKLWTLEADDATVFIVDIYARPATAA
jgi:environmental stress-induced protein Ves